MDKSAAPLLWPVSSPGADYGSCWKDALQNWGRLMTEHGALQLQPETYVGTFTLFDHISSESTHY